MSDNVKVVVRCRPLNSKERGLNCKKIVTMDAKLHTVDLVKVPGTMNEDGEFSFSVTWCYGRLIASAEDDSIPKSFKFDSVYDEYSLQKSVYEEVAFPLVESVLEGYNGTIFAYGQTGCGKTFTMVGPPDPDMKGIIPNSFSHIFESIALISESTKKFLVHASYLEIYNENIRDLLSEDPSAHLNLREDPERGVYVDKLCKVSVKNADQMLQLMTQGNFHRMVGATEMNKDSSRSHSIFVVRIETSEMVMGEERIKAGKLNLVDLAGSERQSKTKATGQRLKEATKINLSLSALGNVISALVEGKGKHIPYRDSKLTRLLQDSLGGNTKTIMIANVSPADYNYDETLSTLRYANRAKNIKNAPKINEDPKDALLREYQTEIAKLKEMLGSLQTNGSNPADMINMFNNKMKTINEDYEGELAVKKIEIVQDPNLLEQVSLLESQKLKAAQEAEELRLLKEKSDEEKRALEQHLNMLQEALLDGGKKVENALLEKEEETKRAELLLSRQKKRELELRREVEKQQAAVSSVEQKYTSIAESLSSQLESMTQKFNAAVAEIKDISVEFEKDREDYLDEIREANKEAALYKQILSEVMTSTDIERIVANSRYNENKECWFLPTIEIAPIAITRLEVKSAKQNPRERNRTFTVLNSKSPEPIMPAFVSNFNSFEKRQELMKSLPVRPSFTPASVTANNVSSRNDLIGNLPSRPAFIPANNSENSVLSGDSSSLVYQIPDVPVRASFNPAGNNDVKHKEVVSPFEVPKIPVRPNFEPAFESRSEHPQKRATFSVACSDSNSLSASNNILTNLPSRPSFQPAIQTSVVINHGLNVADVPSVPSRPSFQPANNVKVGDVLIANSESVDNVLNLRIPHRASFQPAKISELDVQNTDVSSKGLNINVPLKPSFQPAIINSLKSYESSVNVANVNVPSKPAFQPATVGKMESSPNALLMNLPPPRPSFQPGK